MKYRNIEIQKDRENAYTQRNATPERPKYINTDIKEESKHDKQQR